MQIKLWLRESGRRRGRYLTHSPREYLNQANSQFRHHLQLANHNEMYSKISLLLGLSLLSLTVCGVQGAAVDLVVEKLLEPEAAQSVDLNAVPEQCHQPKETGRCFALFYRYAFNLDTHSCEEFIYGGCAGNSNNFESLELCEHTCLGKAAPATATDISLTLTTDQPETEEATTIKLNAINEIPSQDKLH